MPSINITASEVAAGSGVPTNTGTLFAAGATDGGPLGYQFVQSLSQFASIYGPRSSGSAVLYDSLDEFFSDGGSQAYVARVTDNTATAATLTFLDSGPHPTVLVTALTPGLEGNTYQVGVTVASGSATYVIEDASGNTLETWGPYASTSAAYAAINSAYVKFSQSAGSGFTTNQPVTTAPAALSGGADASDLTDASHVSTLGVFDSTLGPGTVILPGKTSTTAWTGLAAHAQANNRLAVLDMVDSATAATNVTNAANLTGSVDLKSRCVLIQGSLVLPGVAQNAFVNRTVPGSAGVAALRAGVQGSSGINYAPAGPNNPLNRPIGFTTFYGTASPVLGGTSTFTTSDVASMAAAGVNCFAAFYGVNCLFGYRAAVLQSQDNIYWQATAFSAVMAIKAVLTQLATTYLFSPINPQTISAWTTDLKAAMMNFWPGTLYGATASAAFQVATDSPVNTAATAQAGQLNADISVKISPYAEAINIAISVLQLSQTIQTS